MLLGLFFRLGGELRADVPPEDGGPDIDPFQISANPYGGLLST